MQLDLFPTPDWTATEPESLPMPDTLHIIAHKCRGETTFEIALRWDFGTQSDPAPWWILQTTGNRVYPFAVLSAFKPVNPPTAPINHRDFYQPARVPTPNATAKPKPKPTLDDLL